MSHEARQAALDAGVSPLEFMLQVMRNVAEEAPRRLDAAKAAAPYLHARLSAVEHSGEMVHHHESWLDELEGS